MYGTPKIKMESPINSDMIVEDKTNYKIIWDSKNIIENRVNIYYSINTGSKWIPIALDIPNKGFYNWIIPSLNTVNCIFKIESSLQNEIFDFSDYSFKITEKPLILLENDINDMIYYFPKNLIIKKKHHY